MNGEKLCRCLRLHCLTNHKKAARQIRLSSSFHEVNKPLVYLHHLKPFGLLPSISPACLKTETYLRMADIPYVNKYGIKGSPKGKIPWIKYKDKVMGDSNFIIKFLNEEFEVDLDDGLTPEEKAISLTIMRMVEENTYWTLVFYRWIENFSETSKCTIMTRISALDTLLKRGFQRRAKSDLRGQGIGRHRREEIYQIATDDLHALSSILGEKKFLMGDVPHLVDASVFGLLASILWAAVGSPQHAVIKGSFDNLEQYCMRMKSKFWRDWDGFSTFENQRSTL